ncbi:MAG: SpoIIE family protein phosphatase, partial [Chloroflexi bacterium]|nr:SpoIIE family protein phosphatase [Chloroflexota bacterium]
ETSLIGAVAKRGKALLVNDVTREPMYAFDPAAPNTAAELVVPLKAEGKLLGVLEVQSDKTGSFSPTDLYVMQTLGDQVALALQQAQLFASVQQEAYVSNVLLQVADAIGSLTDVGEILQTVTRLTPLLVGVQRMIVLLWDYEREALVTAESYGLSQERAAQIKGTPTAASLLFPDEDEIYGTSPKEVTLPEPLAEQWQMSKALALPLVLRGALIGMFCLDVPQPVDARRQSLLAGIANQTALAIEAAQLEYERDKRAGLDQELGIGRSIQAALLPDAPPVIGGFDIAAVWRPARQVAGDFYDFIPLLENHWGLIVADVADKGVPAAIYMTLARTIIRAIALGKASRRTPHQVLERANEIILSDARTDLFVTAFYAVLDPSQNTLCYTNAGHNPPLLVRYEDHRVERLYVPGIALGVLSTIELAEQTVDLQPGDLAVLYTDGVTEATDADYGLFGIERLSGAILDAHHNSAQAVVDRILSAVEAFVGRQEQTDDLTIVVVRRLP